MPVSRQLPGLHALLAAGVGGGLLGRAINPPAAAPTPEPAFDPSKLVAGGAVAGGGLLTYLLAKKMFGAKPKPQVQPEPQADDGSARMQAMLEALGHRQPAGGNRTNINVSPVFSLMAPTAEPQASAEKGAAEKTAIIGAIGNMAMRGLGAAGKSFASVGKGLLRGEGTPFARMAINRDVAKGLGQRGSKFVDDAYAAAQRHGATGVFNRAKGFLPFTTGGTGAKAQWLAKQQHAYATGDMNARQAAQWKHFLGKTGVRQGAGQPVSGIESSLTRLSQAGAAPRYARGRMAIPGADKLRSGVDDATQGVNRVHNEALAQAGGDLSKVNWHAPELSRAAAGRDYARAAATHGAAGRVPLHQLQQATRGLTHPSGGGLALGFGLPTAGAAYDMFGGETPDIPQPQSLLNDEGGYTPRFTADEAPMGMRDYPSAY